MSLAEIQNTLREMANPKLADQVRRTEDVPGQSERVYLGVRVPFLIRLAERYRGVEDNQIRHLLRSPVHDERHLALRILDRRYQEGDEDDQESIFELYLRSTRFIDHWDLVDCSAPAIPGRHLLRRSKNPLYNLAHSNIVWERRIAIVATLTFIENNLYRPTLRIARILLRDGDAAVQEAVGWMLREVARRRLRTARWFLNWNHRKMPRVMLHNAIQGLPDKLRQRWLQSEDRP